MQRCDHAAECVQVPAIVLSGIVHDLNNALFTICELLPSLRELNNSDGVVSRIAELERTSGHAVEMTRLLGALINPRSSENMVVDVVELVRKAEMIALAGARVRCEVCAGCGEWLVDGKETELLRVIVNILLNARQAMNGSGGCIRVKLENVDAGHGGELPMKAGRYAKISISDNGEGIRPENLMRIFEDGFTTRVKGSGIGLALSARIVKEHGGCIDVKSDVGKGTTFGIYLPVSSSATVRKVGAKKF